MERGTEERRQKGETRQVQDVCGFVEASLLRRHSSNVLLVLGVHQICIRRKSVGPQRGSSRDLCFDGDD
jgi:hypothetical protein